MAVPLERGRLLLSLPVNALARLVFLLASHFLQERTSVAGAEVVFYNSQHELGTPGNRVVTNIITMQVIRGEASDVLEERIAGTLQLPPRSAITGPLEKSETAGDRHPHVCGGQ